MREQFTVGSNKDGSQESVQLGLLNEMLLNTIQDLVFVIKVTEGPLFQYVYMNKRARTHIQVPGNYYGKTFQEMVAAEDAQFLTTMYAQAVKKRESVIFQNHAASEDGTIAYYESLLNPIFDASGACQYIVCITRNVTERVHKEKELLESQMRYRSILDYNSDSIFSLDTDGRIVYANPATYTIFGYKVEELNEQYIFDVLPVEDREVLLSVFRQSLAGQAVKIDSHKCYRQNGEDLYVHFKTIPIVIHGEITGVYLVARDITKQVQNELRTEYYAYYDQLTGLLNPISFAQYLSNYLESKLSFSLLYIDLYEFHIVNDLMGHDGGDEVLKETVERLQGVLPEGAHLFRQHGDQFALLIQQTEKKDIVQTAEKLLQSMQRNFILKGEEFSIGISIGIVICPKDGTNRQTLLKRADLALERAKEYGKSYYAFYHNVLDQERERRFMLEHQLALALERKEFALYYQPQVNIMTQQVTGLEALLRWNNRELGFVPPNYFIPLAERTGFIFKIDEWVLFEACRQLREWMDKGYDPVPVSVNISAKQFHSIKIVESIIKALKMYQIPPSLLVIEITEGALVHEIHAEQVLLQLKQHGIGIHLDDFGTGYSSLGYLKKYPIDTIKIDRAFIQEVIVDERDAKIITAIIHLAHTLGMDVIAEGVEQAEQIQFLQSKNAILAQGYYFSKPLPIEEVESFCFKR